MNGENRPSATLVIRPDGTKTLLDNRRGGRIDPSFAPLFKDLEVIDQQKSAPGYMTASQSRQIFGDIISELHRAFNEDNGIDHSVLLQARHVVELWYMRDGVERDQRYCEAHRIR